MFFEIAGRLFYSNHNAGRATRVMVYDHLATSSHTLSTSRFFVMASKRSDSQRHD